MKTKKKILLKNYLMIFVVLFTSCSHSITFMESKTDEVIIQNMYWRGKTTDGNHFYHTYIDATDSIKKPLFFIESYQSGYGIDTIKYENVLIKSTKSRFKIVGKLNGKNVYNKKEIKFSIRKKSLEKENLKLSSKYLIRNIQLITDSINFKLDSSEFSKLPKIQYNYECVKNDHEFSWHVMDLNNDGLKDVISLAPCDPYYQTVVFINNGSNLRKVYEYPGRLLAVKENGSGSIIHILKSSCCCDYYSELVEVKIDSNNKLSHCTFSYHEDTEVELNQNLELTKINVSGILRTKPIVNNNSFNDPCSSQIIHGNRILELDNDEVTIIATKNDWHLVVHIQNDNHHIIGWINKEQ